MSWCVPGSELRLLATPSRSRTSSLWFCANADTTAVAVLGPWPAASSVGAVSVSSQFSASSGSDALCDFANVLEDGDAGEASPEDVSSVLVGFAEEGVLEPGFREPSVEPPDSAEQRPDIHRSSSPSTVLST